MADNTQLYHDPAWTEGDVVRGYDDSDGRKWYPGVFSWLVTPGDPDTLASPSPAALGDTDGNPTTLRFGACAQVWSGSVWARMKGDADGHVHVDVESSALPAGAATAANQATAIASLATLAGAVSGAEVQVDIVSLPAVDTELPAAAALADDMANPTAPAVGAFAMLWDGSTWDRAKGNATDGLLVNLGANNDVTIGAALPAGGNTIGDVTLSGAALTALQLLDDAIFADDAAFVTASSKVGAVGYLFDDVASDTVDEGDIGIGRMSARREQYMQIRDAAGNERGANVDSAGRLSVAIGSSIAILVTASGSDGDAYIGSKPTHIVGGFDGITLKAWAMDSTGNGQVDIVGALPAGTNNIGDVDVLTQPARAATTDTITAKLATDAIHNGTTALTPKFAVIDAATSGDNTLVAAVASKKIRVLSLFLISAGSVNARFESGAGGTALTGQMNLVANSGFSLPFNPVGWFETGSNTLLNLELSAAISVDGCLVYVEV